MFHFSVFAFREMSFYGSLCGGLDNGRVVCATLNFLLPLQMSAAVMSERALSTAQSSPSTS